MEEATIWYFDILKCGYYIPLDKDVQFGQLPDTLKKLTKWGKGIGQIGNTKTYQADPAKNIRNTYFYDSHYDSNNGDYLLILWNEIPNENGKLYGINPKSSPGSSNMLSTKFSERLTIPGFPSYFWFIPEYDLVASIRFNHSIPGKENMQRFLSGFLTNKSPYRVINSDTKKILGYSSNNPPVNGYENILPKFHSSSSKNLELERELLTNASSITRMIKKETIDYLVNDGRDMIEKFFANLLQNAPVFTEKKHVIHELQYRPNIADLKTIIANFNNRTQESVLDNVGFILKGGKTIMLGGINIKILQKLNVTRKENEFIKAKSLMDALLVNRTKLLAAWGSSS